MKNVKNVGMKMWNNPILKELVCGFILLFVVGIGMIFAQDVKLSDLSTKLNEGATSVGTIVKIIVRIILALGAVFAVYAFISDNPKKREVAIGIGTGILISEIMWAVLGL